MTIPCIRDRSPFSPYPAVRSHKIPFTAFAKRLPVRRPARRKSEIAKLLPPRDGDRLRHKAIQIGKTIISTADKTTIV